MMMMMRCWRRQRRALRCRAWRPARRAWRPPAVAGARRPADCVLVPPRRAPLRAFLESAPARGPARNRSGAASVAPLPLPSQQRRGSVQLPRHHAQRALHGGQRRRQAAANLGARPEAGARPRGHGPRPPPRPLDRLTCKQNRHQHDKALGRGQSSSSHAAAGYSRTPTAIASRSLERSQSIPIAHGHPLHRAASVPCRHQRVLDVLPPVAAVGQEQP